jgi:hypothetical protein
MNKSSKTRQPRRKQPLLESVGNNGSRAKTPPARATEVAVAKPTGATNPENEPDRKYIKIEAPCTYEEVLMLIPRKLPCHNNINCSYHVFEFFVDVVESYLPALAKDIREDAEGVGAVLRLRRIAREMRELLAAPDDHSEKKTGWEKFDAAEAKWEQLLQAFAQAHDEHLNMFGPVFADEFESWKQGETDLRD